MTEQEFIKKAKSYGYSEEQVQEFIDLIKSARADGVNMKYDDIVLIEQPHY